MASCRRPCSQLVEHRSPNFCRALCVGLARADWFSVVSWADKWPICLLCFACPVSKLYLPQYKARSLETPGTRAHGPILDKTRSKTWKRRGPFRSQNLWSSVLTCQMFQFPIIEASHWCCIRRGRLRFASPPSPNNMSVMQVMNDNLHPINCAPLRVH